MRADTRAGNGVAMNPVQANEVDVELERSLTTEWDAQIVKLSDERISVRRVDLKSNSAHGLPTARFGHFA